MGTKLCHDGHRCDCIDLLLVDCLCATCPRNLILGKAVREDWAKGRTETLNEESDDSTTRCLDEYLIHNPVAAADDADTCTIDATCGDDYANNMLC